MLPHVQVEYVAGPACGRVAAVPVGPSGEPPPLLMVAVEPRIVSALERPIPASVHRYRRNTNATGPDGQPVWRYQHLGPLGQARLPY